MDQVSQTKRQFRIEQWRQCIAECQSSGMPVRNWCKENYFSEQTYYKYLKTFRLEFCEQLPVPVEVPEKTVALRRLEVMSPLPNTQSVVIIRLL